MPVLCDRRTPAQYACLVFTGAAMGAADVVPGVSGGTMAFILGVYEELIETIKAFNLTWVRLLLRRRFRDALLHINLPFLLALGGGLLAALLSLAHVVSWLLAHHPEPLFALFFGLVAASVLAVSTHVRWGASRLLTLAAGTLLAYWVVGLVPLEMPHAPWMLFLSGAVAICAMILPGISGSFLLLILGQYAYVLEAVKTFDLLVLMPFMFGMAAGIGGFSRLLSWLLKHVHQLTVTLLIGFMLGSLRRIWPFKRVVGDTEGALLREVNVLPDVTQSGFWLAVGLCIAGFILISLLDHVRSRNNPLVGGCMMVFRNRKRP